MTPGAGRESGRGRALVVVDMLNLYEHEDADTLRRSVAEVLPAMVMLRDRAIEAGIPLIYVNDNFGRWADGRAEICERALRGADPALVEPILPPPDAAFIVKARHSIFFQTQLDYMLRREGLSGLILVGQVTEQCILYSALDGYVRHYEVIVPRDAVAHIHPDLAAAAVAMMEINMRAEITTAADCQLD